MRYVRDWRQGGGNQVVRHANNQSLDVLPSPTFSASRKKQKTFQSVGLLVLIFRHRISQRISVFAYGFVLFTDHISCDTQCSIRRLVLLEIGHSVTV